MNIVFFFFKKKFHFREKILSAFSIRAMKQEKKEEKG
jgi:hypothetical protein